LNYHKSALDNIHSCLKIATEIKSLTHFQQAYEVLSDYYQKYRNTVGLLEYYKLSASYKDSVLNEKTAGTLQPYKLFTKPKKRKTRLNFYFSSMNLNSAQSSGKKIKPIFYY